MANFSNPLKKRSTIIAMVLCVVIAASLYFWDRHRVHENVNNPDSVWTVTMEDETTSYTFHGPLDMFLIHKSEITSLRKLTASTSSLTMEWHYETGQPWRRWARENPEKQQSTDTVQLSASVDIESADTDPAATAKLIYWDNEIKHANPAVNANQLSKVWNNTALKFERRYDTHYLIEEREPYDGRVITCTASPWYCRLEGARVNDTLALNHVLVWKEDVMNWKQYQDKARALIEQAIVK